MGGNGRSFGFQVAMISLLGWFALWSCAPPSVVAPMVPLDKEKGWDLGLAASGGALITTNEPWDTGVEVGEHQIEVAAGGQLWAIKDLGRVDLGGTLGGFGTRADGGPHLGVMVRPHLIERERLVVGLDAQIGMLWYSLGVPVAARLSDRIWLYTEPSVGGRYTGIVNMPVGVSIEMAERARLSAEVDYLMGDMGYIDGPVVLGTVGLSFRP